MAHQQYNYALSLNKDPFKTLTGAMYYTMLL